MEFILQNHSRLQHLTQWMQNSVTDGEQLGSFQKLQEGKVDVTL